MNDNEPQPDARSTPQLDNLNSDTRLAKRLPKMMSLARDELKKMARALMLSQNEQNKLSSSFEAAISKAGNDPYIEQLVKSLPEVIDAQNPDTRLDVLLMVADIQEHLLRREQKALAGAQEAFLKEEAKLDQETAQWDHRNGELEGQEAQFTKTMAEMMKGSKQLDSVETASVQEAMVAPATDRDNHMQEKRQLDARREQLMTNKDEISDRIKDKSQVLITWRQAATHHKNAYRSEKAALQIEQGMKHCQSKADLEPYRKQITARAENCSNSKRDEVQKRIVQLETQDATLQKQLPDIFNRKAKREARDEELQKVANDLIDAHIDLLKIDLERRQLGRIGAICSLRQDRLPAVAPVSPEIAIEPQIQPAQPSLVRSNTAPIAPSPQQVSTLRRQESMPTMGNIPQVSPPLPSRPKRNDSLPTNAPSSVNVEQSVPDTVPDLRYDDTKARQEVDVKKMRRMQTLIAGSGPREEQDQQRNSDTQTSVRAPVGEEVDTGQAMDSRRVITFEEMEKGFHELNHMLDGIDSQVSTNIESIEANSNGRSDVGQDGGEISPQIRGYDTDESTLNFESGMEFGGDDLAQDPEPQQAAPISVTISDGPIELQKAIQSAFNERTKANMGNSVAQEHARKLLRQNKSDDSLSAAANKLLEEILANRNKKLQLPSDADGSKTTVTKPQVLPTPGADGSKTVEQPQGVRH